MLITDSKTQDVLYNNSKNKSTLNSMYEKFQICTLKYSSRFLKIPTLISQIECGGKNSSNKRKYAKQLALPAACSIIFLISINFFSALIFSLNIYNTN